MIEVSVGLKAKKQGGHVHIGVFVGKDAQHRGKAGDLVLRVEEWVSVMEALQRNNALGLVSFEIDYDPKAHQKDHKEGCAFPIQACVCAP